MRSFVRLNALIFLCFITFAAWAQAHDSDNAKKVVEQAASEVIAVLKEKGDEIKQSPDHLYKLVDQYVLPHFDFQRMSYYILGRYWKQATPEQQAAFLKEFKHLLVNTYATALSSFTNEEEIIYQSVQITSNADVVVVPTEIRQVGSPPVMVAYRMYRSEDKWRIFDVAIGGVSLVTNYRANFAGQIRKRNEDGSEQGMDGLIKSLQEHNQQKQAAQSTVDTAANSQ